MTLGRRRVLLAAALFLVALAGTAIWLGRSDPELPKKVWHCAATDALRESAAGPLLEDFVPIRMQYDPTGCSLHIVRPFSVRQRVRLALGRSEMRSTYRLHPTGASASDGGQTWDEYTVEPHWR